MREGVESIVNPFDEYALEENAALKDRLGAKVSVVSMGPPQAAAVLREALARGADEAFLVSSRAFGGADTLATSYTLSQAIRKVCGGKTPDLVLFGKQAIDGDTAQVGPGVSEFLGVPLVTYVKELAVEATGAYTATTVMDDGEHVIAGSFPCVMTVLKGGRRAALRAARRLDAGREGGDRGAGREGHRGRPDPHRPQGLAHEGRHDLPAAHEGAARRWTRAATRRRARARLWTSSRRKVW